jgi:hypothetical protein
MRCGGGRRVVRARGTDVNGRVGEPPDRADQVPLGVVRDIVRLGRHAIYRNLQHRPGSTRWGEQMTPGTISAARGDSRDFNLPHRVGGVVACHQMGGSVGISAITDAHGPRMRV